MKLNRSPKCSAHIRVTYGDKKPTWRQPKDTVSCVHRPKPGVASQKLQPCIPLSIFANVVIDRPHSHGTGSWILVRVHQDKAARCIEG